MVRLLTASTLVAAAAGKVYFEDNFDAGIEKWTASEWKVRLHPPPPLSQRFAMDLSAEN